MSMLLEDLAEETIASNKRVSDRVDLEVRHLRELSQVMAAFDGLRQRAVESARQATDYALARLPQAEAAWQQTLQKLRRDPFGEEAERLLRSHHEVFESGARLSHSPRALWAFVVQLGGPTERVDELEHAESRFRELAAEAELALEHRQRDWQPADPARLALGLQLAREGKTVSAAEARVRIRRS